MKRARILGGIFLITIGLFGLFLGVRYLFGLESLQQSGLSCRAICGLGLLASQIIDEKLAILLVGTLWLIAGFFLTRFGYVICSKKSG